MPFADSAQAVSARSVQPLIPSQEGTPVVSAGVDPSPSGGSGQIQSLSGSYVVFDPSYGGDDEYIPGTTQTLCFRSESYTTDYEYVYSNWLKFPSTWNVTDVTVVGGTPACDSGASWGTFAWAYQTSPYEVRIDHPRYQQTTDHCVAAYCVEVTSSYAGDPAPVSWYFPAMDMAARRIIPAAWTAILLQDRMPAMRARFLPRMCRRMPQACSSLLKASMTKDVMEKWNSMKSSFTTSLAPKPPSA